MSTLKVLTPGITWVLLVKGQIPSQCIASVPAQHPTVTLGTWCPPETTQQICFEELFIWSWSSFQYKPNPSSISSVLFFMGLYFWMTLYCVDSSLISVRSCLYSAFPAWFSRLSLGPVNCWKDFHWKHLKALVVFLQRG
jgi:hypothetical protein